jgi:hypothetical protein
MRSTINISSMPVALGAKQCFAYGKMAVAWQSMIARDENETSTIRARIEELLNAGAREESEELLSLLESYWSLVSTEFGTKMEPSKTMRIFDISWTPPVLEFRIERHPGAWNRVQRWTYDFNLNEASLASEWSPPENPRYTKKQVHEDAQRIVDALLTGAPHSCVQNKGHYYHVWMGRLPATKPLPYQLPMRTAKGRQARLKDEVANLMKVHPEFVRVAGKETTGSLVYKRQAGSADEP